MNFETTIGIVSILLAVVAIVLVFVFRSYDRDIKVKAIESRLETFNRDANDLLNKCSGIAGEIQNLRAASQSLRPELSLFLATQWRFIEKSLRYRFEKHNIARKIATKYVKTDMQVLLDSGSTTDLVTSELLVSPVTGVHIYSNNVIAAMHLVGTKQVRFHLFQGLFSERFAAVYSNEANSRMDQLGLDIFVLAATGIQFETGIMVHKDDVDNFEFKRMAIGVFKSTSDCTLLIAVDPSKFFTPTDDLRVVVTQEEWTDIVLKAASRIVLITSPASPDFTSAQRAKVAEEIERFRQAGIQVDEGL